MQTFAAWQRLWARTAAAACFRHNLFICAFRIVLKIYRDYFAKQH